MSLTVLTSSLPGKHEEPLAESPIASNQVDSIKDYYSGLKAPYCHSLDFMRLRLSAEQEKLQLCRNEMALKTCNKQRRAFLQMQAKSHQLEIDDIESGINWSLRKIKKLDLQQEERIRLAAGWGDSQAVPREHSVSRITMLA